MPTSFPKIPTRFSESSSIPDVKAKAKSSAVGSVFTSVQRCYYYYATRCIINVGFASNQGSCSPLPVPTLFPKIPIRFSQSSSIPGVKAKGKSSAVGSVFTSVLHFYYYYYAIIIIIVIIIIIITFFFSFFFTIIIIITIIIIPQGVLLTSALNLARVVVCFQCQHSFQEYRSGSAFQTVRKPQVTSVSRLRWVVSGFTSVLPTQFSHIDVCVTLALNESISSVSVTPLHHSCQP